jgi:hypothetical protein
MLSYGCTRLEIGVQSTYEDVARDTNRGHTVAAVADCFCLAKDAGFKVICFLNHSSFVFLAFFLTCYISHDFLPTGSCSHDARFT